MEAPVASIVKATWKSSPIKATRDSIIRGSIETGSTRSQYVDSEMSHKGGKLSNERSEKSHEAKIIVDRNQYFDKILQAASAMFDDDEDFSHRELLTKSNSMETPAAPTADLGSRNIKRGSLEENVPLNDRVSHTKVHFQDELVLPVLSFSRARTKDKAHSAEAYPKVSDTNPSPLSEAESLGISNISENDEQQENLFGSLLLNSKFLNEVPPPNFDLYFDNPEGIHVEDFDQNRDNSLLLPAATERPDYEADKRKWNKYSEDADLMSYTSYLIMLTDEFGDGVPALSNNETLTGDSPSCLEIAEQIEFALREHMKIPIKTLQLSVLNTHAEYVNEGVFDMIESI